MAGDVKGVQHLIGLGVEALAKIPTESVHRTIGEMPTLEVLTQAVALEMTLRRVNEGIGGAQEMLPEVNGVAVDVRDTWRLALDGSRNPDATAVLTEADGLLQGSQSVATLAGTLFSMEAKAEQVRGHFEELYKALGELSALRERAEREAAGLHHNTAHAAQAAQQLVASWGGQEQEGV